MILDRLLEQRATSANHAWYELQQPQMGIYPQFDMPKVIYPDIAKQPEFSYDSTGAYVSNTMYILPTDELYLLGILNSATVGFFYAQISSSIQSDYMRFIATYMGQVPIPAATPAQRAAIESLVRKLLDAHRADLTGLGDLSGLETAWEAELNALVYQVYGLTREEIVIIEGR